MTGISSSINNFPIPMRRKDYALLTLATVQTAGFAQNNPIKLDTISVDSNMYFDAANFKVLLKAGRHYTIKGGALGGTGGIAGADALLTRIRDVTNSVNYGTIGYSLSVNYNYANTAQPICVASITPASDIYISLVLNEATNLTYIYNGYAFMEVTEIESFTPIVSGYQDAYESPLFDLIINSRGVNKVAGQAKVKFNKDQGGQWYADIWIGETVASGARTGQQWFTNLIFLAAAANTYHKMTGWCADGVVAPLYVLAYPGGGATQGRIDIYHANATTTTYCVGDKVPLASKPTGYAIPADV